MQSCKMDGESCEPGSHSDAGSGQATGDRSTEAKYRELQDPRDSASQGQDDKVYGGQTIGLMGSIALIVNSVIGPGIVELPRLFQTSGWLAPTLTLTLAFIFSSFACTMTCEAIQKMPGNHYYTRRNEYCEMVTYYMANKKIGSVSTGSKKKWEYISLVLLCISLTCLNVGSIVVTAQTMDQVILLFFEKTYAIGFGPLSWLTHKDIHVTPFAGSSAINLVLSLGYLVSCALLMPLGFLTLEDNIYFQYVSFFVFLGIIVAFLCLFAQTVKFDRVPMIGTDISATLGVSIFCYSYATAIPSWVNEKKRGVSPSAAIWGAALPSTLLKIAFGWVGALALDNLSDNILEDYTAKMAGQGVGGFICNLMTFAFSFFVVGFGVPLFHIFVTYNLVNTRVCSHRSAQFWGVIFPWLVSWLVYSGNLYERFMVWSSMFFNGSTCFLMPMLVFIFAMWSNKDYFPVTAQLLGDEEVREVNGHSDPQEGQEGEEMVHEPTVRAVPRWLGNPTVMAVVLFGLTLIGIIVAIWLNVAQIGNSSPKVGAIRHHWPPYPN